MTRTRTHDLIMSRVDELSRELYQLRKQLAGGEARETIESDRFSVLTCRVGNDRVGLLQEHVHEVVQFATLVPLPEAPPWVVGLLNLRGESVPVVDAVARLGRNERMPVADDFIVICQAGSQRIGLVVQEIFELQPCMRDDLMPPPRELPFAPYVLGLMPSAPHPVLIFSLQTLVASSDVPRVGDDLVH